MDVPPLSPDDDLRDFPVTLFELFPTLIWRAGMEDWQNGRGQRRARNHAPGQRHQRTGSQSADHRHGSLVSFRPGAGRPVEDAG